MPIIHRKALSVNPSTGDNHDRMTQSNLAELNNYLEAGWLIEDKIVIPCSTSAPAYKGLSSVIFIMSKTIQDDQSNQKG